MRAIKIKVTQDLVDVPDMRPIREVVRSPYARVLKEGEDPAKQQVQYTEDVYYPRKVMNIFREQDEPALWFVQESDFGIIENLIELQKQDVERFGQEKYNRGYKMGYADGAEYAHEAFKLRHNNDSLWTRLKRAFTNYKV